MHPQQIPAADVPFSLVCSECDAGTHIESHAQAIAEGWTDIDHAPDLPMANYLGLCPGCRETFEHWTEADAFGE